MKIVRSVIQVLALSVAPGLYAATDYPVQPVPFTEVRFTGGLWQQRQATNAQVTVPFALDQCESSKRMQNFDLAAETMRRRAAGETNFQNKPVTQYPFDDSDVYKAMEGAAFCLSVKPDPALSKRLDGMIARIAAAQEPDGYLYSWRTMHPDSPVHEWIDAQRWRKDPELSHELYNLGHLYEAGVAHAQATGQTNLLAVCLKSAELVYHDFGDGRTRMPPGHQVIEMGLVKLYRRTGDHRYLDLAKFFIDSRGYGNRPYSQDHKPAVEQTEAVGHAVRANYFYSGMADVAALTGDQRYLAAINRIWENVVTRKLHLTGGCGARADGEAYGADYELPNKCYNETCAAIAFLFWNQRMFLMTGDAKYMDTFERTLYNGFLSGVSLSGDRFFYPNPLEYDGQTKNNHGFAGRAPWFGCACCPPNAVRMLASLGGYAYAVEKNQLFVNLYAAGEVSAKVAGAGVRLAQETDYPWNGAIKLRVSVAAPTDFVLCLRLPGWVEGHPVPSDLYTYEDAKPAAWSVKVNGAAVKAAPESGYLRLARSWRPGDVVTLDLPMPVRRVLGNPNIAATRGLVALERGPVVYCFEGIDNGGAVSDVVLPASARVVAKPEPRLLNGVVTLAVTGAQRLGADSSGATAEKSAKLVAIPYYAWNNRGNSPMTVWVNSSRPGTAGQNRAAADRPR